MFQDIVKVIRDRFAARHITGVEVVGGVDSRNASDNFGAGGSWRVAFVPPEDDGDFAPPIHVGEGEEDENDETARQLHTMKWPFDVCCAARDEDRPEDDLANRARCFALWQVVAQELHPRLADQVFDLLAGRAARPADERPPDGAVDQPVEAMDEPLPRSLAIGSVLRAQEVLQKALLVSRIGI